MRFVWSCVESKRKSIFLKQFKCFSSINKKTGDKKYIECVVTDVKAHSYNKYPDGQPYDTGDAASFDVKNGIIQTGIAYPNSYNAKKDLACSPDHMNGSVIEFAAQEVDFNVSDYILDKVVIVDEEN